MRRRLDPRKGFYGDDGVSGGASRRDRGGPVPAEGSVDGKIGAQPLFGVHFSGERHTALGTRYGGAGYAADDVLARA